MGNLRVVRGPGPLWSEVLVCFLSVLGAITASNAEAGIELINDPAWLTGFRVIAPKPLGKKVFQGVLNGPLSGEREPQWQLAQWSSRFSLAGATPERREDGSIAYRDPAKTVRFGKGELVLGIDSIIEWKGRSRKKGEPWPHLLVSQEFQDRCPPLSKIATLPFHIEACLVRDDREEPPGYSPRIHAAQCLLYLIIKNVNPASKGRGDFLWLGVPIYDDRGPVKGHVIGGDVAHNKVIFMPPREAYTHQETTLGEWTTFRADLLPLAKEALNAAWEIGKMNDSRNLADYRVAGMNLGWDMPGNHRVEIRFRNLPVKVEMKDSTQPDPSSQ